MDMIDVNHYHPLDTLYLNELLSLVLKCSRLLQMEPQGAQDILDCKDILATPLLLELQSSLFQSPALNHPDTDIQNIPGEDHPHSMFPFHKQTLSIHQRVLGPQTNQHVFKGNVLIENSFVKINLKLVHAGGLGG